MCVHVCMCIYMYMHVWMCGLGLSRPEGLGVEPSIVWQALGQLDLQHLESAEHCLRQWQQVAQGAIQAG